MGSLGAGVWTLGPMGWLAQPLDLGSQGIGTQQLARMG